MGRGSAGRRRRATARRGDGGRVDAAQRSSRRAAIVVASRRERVRAGRDGAHRRRGGRGGTPNASGASLRNRATARRRGGRCGRQRVVVAARRGRPRGRGAVGAESGGGSGVRLRCGPGRHFLAGVRESQSSARYVVAKVRQGPATGACNSWGLRMFVGGCCAAGWAS